MTLLRTFGRTVIATQAQSYGGLGSRAVSATQIIAQSQAATVVKQIDAVRVITQGQTALTTKQAALTRIATQAESVLLIVTKVVLRSLLVTQATAARLLKQAQLRAPLRAL